jgi:hypothetical protein
MHPQKPTRGNFMKAALGGELTVATVRFLSDWSQQQDGDIRAGESLRIEYDPPSGCRAAGRTSMANLHGVSRPISVFIPVGGQSARVAPVSQLWEVAVPHDAKQIEIWFNNTDQTGCI